MMSGEGHGDVPRLAGLEGFEVWDRRVKAPVHKELNVAFVSVCVSILSGRETTRRGIHEEATVVVRAVRSSDASCVSGLSARRTELR